jgi:hypothetical protein
MENSAAGWNVYVDPPGSRVCYTMGVGGIDSTPTGDNRALLLAIDPCTNAARYTGLHVYENLPFKDADAFVFSLWFRYLPGTNPVQAIEFSMNKWTGGSNRFEWAVQYENVGDGSPDQGSPPTWRLWDGSRWRGFTYNQRLDPGVWHKLQLFGDILNRKVRYRELTCDGVRFVLGQMYSPVRDTALPKLAVAVQLDGDFFMTPQQLLLDGVGFQWFPLLLPPTLEHGTNTLRFFVPAGATCAVERTRFLTNGLWTSLTNVIGGDSNVLVRDPATRPERFYRLRAL